MKTRRNNEDFGSCRTFNIEEYATEVKYVWAEIKQKLIHSQTSAIKIGI